MKYDSWFDADENKALLAVCARKLIRNIGIGGIIWGLINIGIGVIALEATLLNAGLVLLGLLMLGTGIQALRSPTLGVLLSETIVTILVFLWNLGISILNFQATNEFNPRGLIFPLIIAAATFNYYRKLQHIREQISSVEPQRIKATQEIYKTLAKKKLKEDKSVVQTTDRKCRAMLMDGKAVFIQRDLMRAFAGSREDIRKSVVELEAKSLTLSFKHPLGPLKYKFDKHSSQKIRDWLSAPPASAEIGPGAAAEITPAL